MTEPVLTPAELGARLRVSRNTAYNLINSGAIRHVRVGSGSGASIRIPESAIAAYLSGQPASLIASAGSTTED